MRKNKQRDIILKNQARNVTHDLDIFHIFFCHVSSFYLWTKTMIIIIILPRNLRLNKKIILKKPEGQNVTVGAAANLVPKAFPPERRESPENEVGL